MPDWKRHVRERLELKGVEAERENEIVEELASYADDAYREAISRGDSEKDALEYAWRQVGDWKRLSDGFSSSGPSAQVRSALQRMEDHERSMSRLRSLPGVLADISQDLRFAARTLKRRPVFTVVVVIALALGIGATTTVFSVADSALLKDLPYRDAGRLVSIWTERQNSRGEWETMSLYPTEHQVLEEHSETLESVALYFFASMTLRGDGYPIDLMAGEATASLSEVSGIRPRLGRWFRPDEVGPDATMVAVLGDATWRNEFGSDPDVIGRTITLDHDLYAVIGVMPPEFRFENDLFQGSRGLLSSRETGERPVWVPLGHSYGARGGPDWYYDREGWSFEAIARLRPGVTLEAAQVDVEAALGGLDPVGPMRVKLAYREDLNVAGLPSQVLLLAIPSLLLLLIACGNVATLLLGEGLNRQAEIATRAALGAGVRRIVRLLLTESLLLGALGSVAGVAVAFGA
ncbi:ABC transporter permease, partial [Gemmatimonadota bacterium]